MRRLVTSVNAVKSVVRSRPAWTTARLSISRSPHRQRVPAPGGRLLPNLQINNPGGRNARGRRNPPPPSDVPGDLQIAGELRKTCKKKKKKAPILASCVSGPLQTVTHRANPVGWPTQPCLREGGAAPSALLRNCVCVPDTDCNRAAGGGKK